MNFTDPPNVGRGKHPFGTLVAIALACLVPNVATANPMDLTPERLTGCTDPTNPVPCGGAVIEGTTLKTNYLRPDNAAWAKLVSQFAAAIAPTAMRPARTTGYAGFEFALYASFTTMANGEAWMQKGTEGGISDGRFASKNGNPDPMLQVYGVSGRKGLPYGFELQGTVGYVASTELVTLGGGLRWSLVEGFRKGAAAAMPDLSVGGYVNTVTGTSKLKMTVPSFDVQISKPVTVANQFVFTPYFGWQILWISVDSAVLDATPGTDAVKDCNGRPSTLEERKAGDSGELHCQKVDKATGTAVDAPAGSPESLARLDLNNNVLFQSVRFRRQRVFLGFHVRYEIAHFGVHFMTDLTSPESGGDDRIAGLARQVTFGFQSGLSW